MKRSHFGIGAVVILILYVLYLYRIFMMTPEDAHMGMVQKIFYIHVPSAMIVYVAFLTAFVCAVIYLRSGKEIFDTASESAMEVGLVFCTAVLLTGPPWARAAWGRWWVWEPRLTMTLFTWLIFVSYFAARKLMPKGQRNALLSSVFLLMGAVSLPLVHFSVRLWRGIHPEVIRRGGIGPEMKMTLVVGILFMLILFVFLFSATFFGAKQHKGGGRI